MDADFLLIRKIKQGDEPAMEDFVRKYYPEILTYCKYRCQDQRDAEDLTQETFARFFKSIAAYRHSGKAKNYLYTIAGNLCRDFYKKKKEIPLEDSRLNDSLEPETGQIEQIVDKLTVGHALQQLPEDYREVIILYYFQELTLSEIAKILQIRLPLVKYRFRQAKIQLEKLLM
ncbi:RNA polymerase sigma factor [Petralouisia muris]|mgnify:CR=1 FL=1|jgi:RNA polymerase sigma-70 factor (ECF subfamily)|uniref:RNA polymerase sigma factor n=1 Tax=Petralouisia muris TaxID=3032872 RepID=A0AC61S1W9_9FIRM|nr:RNA polymerase sigma factor [Petralouisia muris]TGY97985.1 RNA polymerase sigma factor [Petralouisia muris]